MTRTEFKAMIQDLLRAEPDLGDDDLRQRLRPLVLERMRAASGKERGYRDDTHAFRTAEEATEHVLADLESYR